MKYVGRQYLTNRRIRGQLRKVMVTKKGRKRYSIKLVYPKIRTRHSSRMERKNRVEKEVHSPHTVGSGGSDRWYAEVRVNGFLKDWRYFDTESQAREWLRNK